MSRNAVHFRRAFTLIELMLAVVLLALLTGAAAYSFARPIREARARQAMETLTRADAMARDEARRFGHPVRLTFDLRRQAVTRGSNTTALPANYRVSQIRTADQIAEEGQAQIEISALGLSRSYVLHVIGPELDQWLIVAGLSGETTWTNDEAKVEYILRTTSRDDSH